MPEKDYVETRAELEAEIEKAEKKALYYEQKEKILLRKVIPQLTRQERTNRLCTLAGMLESFLVHPELLSNDQVMDLLKIVFRQKEVFHHTQMDRAHAGRFLENLQREIYDLR